MAKNIFEDTNPIARALMQNEAQRVAHMYALYRHLGDETVEMPNVWVAKTIANCQIEALATFLIEKGFFTADQFLNECSKRMIFRLEQAERAFNVSITTDGVYHREAPKDGAENGSEASGPDVGSGTQGSDPGPS